MAIVAAGCPPEHCRSAEQPTVMLGVGLDSFAPLLEGDEVELEAGPQGGHHTWLAARADGLDPAEPWQVTLRGLVDGVVVAEARLRTQGQCGSEWAEAQGLQLRWDGSPPSGLSVEQLENATATVALDISDAAGASAAVLSPAFTLRAPQR